MIFFAYWFEAHGMYPKAPYISLLFFESRLIFLLRQKSWCRLSCIIGHFILFAISYAYFWTHTHLYSIMVWKIVEKKKVEVFLSFQKLEGREKDFIRHWKTTAMCMRLNSNSMCMYMQLSCRIKVDENIVTARWN